MNLPALLTLAGACVVGALDAGSRLESPKLGPNEFEVPALELAGRDRQRVPGLEWRLPDRRPDGRDLVVEMRSLAQLTFEASGPVGGVEPRDGRLRFGDLVVATQGLDGERRDAVLEELRERAPRLWADWGAGLPELLLDDQLHASGWRPKRDDGRDGMIVADDWELGDEAGAPWSSLDVEPRICQAAALIRADLATIKRVENDYRTYYDHVDADYDEIFPLRDTHFRGKDESGSPFSFLTLRFRCDLPFPYSGYDCDLQIVNTTDGGLARTDIHSTSPDFHFLAGRDLFLPVEDSDGRTVAYLLVRHFGFDLDGIPDKPKHRIVALRGALGNLKRKAERAFDAGSDAFELDPTAHTQFRVLGRR